VTARAGGEDDQYDGTALLNAFQAGVANLAAHVEEVNALNVFPVPDGDTGSNMLATAKAALEEGRSVPRAERTVGRVANAIAFGALMGARGNSGVILSQILRGMAKALEGKHHGTAMDLAEAFLHATETAYQAVASPVEGTMLTVMREAASAATEAVTAAGGGTDVQGVLAASVDGAAESVARTPALLAVLREAGVVDAGGQGLFRLLQGGLGYNLGLTDPAAIRALESTPAPAPAAAPRAATDGAAEEFGFETMFMVTAGAAPLDLRAMRDALEEVGTSVLVAGDERLAKVHVHNERPDKVIELGLGWGQLSRITVQNLDEQIDELREAGAAAFAGVAPAAERMSHGGDVAPVAHPRGPAVVAVASGDGLERVLSSLGAERVVRGGQSANPSTGELLQAIRSVPAVEVVLLPNNPNVQFAALKAAELCPEKNVVVVPTRNVGEGIGALMALDANLDASANLTRMTAAAHEIQTLQVVAAVRDANVAGVDVKRGETMVLKPDDGLLASGVDRCAVVLEAVDKLRDGFELVTLYAGHDAEPAEAEELAQTIRDGHDGVEVEIVHGGQPHYSYLIAAE
jgi:DAK2 domain fusion protein YloV